MDFGRALLPVTSPEEFVKAVVKQPNEKPKVTSILLNLFATPFHRLEGKSLMENFAAFQSMYKDVVETLTENLMKLKRAGRPSADELEGVALLRKNEQLSTFFRGNGNVYFKAGDLPMALRCYTLAACYAPPGSHAERLAYSNRSACFAELGNWRKCLEEIVLFEKVDSGMVEPALMEKIGKRKNKCLEEMGVGASKNLEVEPDVDQRFAKELLTTLKNESKLIPGAEEFVGIRRDAVKGRCLYNKGKSPIEPGTLIMVDKAFMLAPKNSLCFETGNCNGCYRQLNGSGIPCPSCVFHIYCSKACAAQSNSKYECQVLPYLYEVEFGTITNMRLALFILFKLGPEGLLSHLRQAKEGGEKIFPGLNPEGLYDSKAFETVNSLSSNELIYEERKTMEACLFAVFATKIVDETTDYFRSLKKVQPDLDFIWVKDEFAKLLVRLSAICTINCVGVGKSSDVKVTPETVRNLDLSIFGIGLFPVMSLLNHSCSPNVVYIGLPDGLMAVVTTQHIAPGQEFLTDYASRFPTPKEVRQADLLKLYGFTCNCPPCKFDWANNVHSGTICPNCRPYRDIDANGMGALEEIKLEETSSHYNCPQCPWRMSKVDHAMMNSGIGLLAETAASNMCAMKGLRTAFCDMQKVVKYCDSTLMKPDGFLGANDDVLVHLLQLFAAKLWGSC